MYFFAVFFFFFFQVDNGRGREKRCLKWESIDLQWSEIIVVAILG